MRRKKCQCCHELYQPDLRTYSQQETCTKPSCRSWRKRRAVKMWKITNPLCAKSNPEKQKKWRWKNRGYWKKWRSKHPGYVARNRKAERARKALRKGVVAKGNEINTVCIEKLGQIRALRLVAKGNEWQETILHQIDGIWRYLKCRQLVAKRNDIDLKGIFVRK
jgi:hypothetical protein